MNNEFKGVKKQACPQLIEVCRQICCELRAFDGSLVTAGGSSPLVERQGADASEGGGPGCVDRGHPRRCPRLHGVQTPAAPRALSASTRRSAPRGPPRAVRVYTVLSPPRSPALSASAPRSTPCGPALGSAERRCLQGGPQKPPGARNPVHPLRAHRRARRSPS